NRALAGAGSDHRRSIRRSARAPHHRFGAGADDRFHCRSECRAGRSHRCGRAIGHHVVGSPSWRGYLSVETLPYLPALDVVSVAATAPEITTSDWRYGLPVLGGGQVVLRELRSSDAASLHSLLTPEEVSRFISPPPETVEGFERFIAWTLRQRTAGADGCVAVT